MPKSSSQPKTSVASLPASFEAGLTELNALVAQMEAGDAPLAQMLAHYQRGAELLQFCEAQLKDAEQQLLVLAGGAEGELTPLAL